MLVPKLRFKREDGTEFLEWQKESFSAVCDIVGGGTPSTEHKEYWNGSIQWFTPSEIGKSKYVSKSERTISQIGFEKSSARKLPVGTLLLTSRATLGEMAIATEECTTNQGFQSLIPQNIYGEYIYYLKPIIKRYCNKKACGSTFNEINKSELGKCIIPVPCLEEQQKIADFLSTVDEVIEQSEAEVQNLEQQKKGVMQKIFSKEVRFKREDGTNFPEWEIKKLGELTKQVNIKNNTSRNYPVYSINNQKGFIPQIDQFEDREVASTDKSNYRVVDYHQFAYNPSRINVGSIAYLKDKINVIVSPLYVIFECLTELNPEFLDIYVRTSDFHKQRKINTAGSVRDSLSYEGFADIKTAIPCFEEQQKIADFLSAYDEAITYAKQELDKWKELKKGLLQQMFV